MQNVFKFLLLTYNSIFTKKNPNYASHLNYLCKFVSMQNVDEKVSSGLIQVKTLNNAIRISSHHLVERSDGDANHSERNTEKIKLDVRVRVENDTKHHRNL